MPRVCARLVFVNPGQENGAFRPVERVSERDSCVFHGVLYLVAQKAKVFPVLFVASSASHSKAGVFAYSIAQSLCLSFAWYGNG